MPSSSDVANDLAAAEDPLLAVAAKLRETPEASPAALRAILSAWTRLYAAACEAAHQELSPLDADVPVTDAITLACALVRSQNLNPFDLAVWFSATRQGTTHEG